MFDDVLEKLKKLGTLGGFGELVFTVKPWPFKTMTFKDANHTASVEYTEHKHITGKPTLEYVGTNLDEVTLTIELNRAWLGSNPLETYKLLNEYRLDGRISFLILGDDTLSNNEFVITKIDKKIEEIDCFGTIQKLELNITFKEYQ